MTFEEKVKLLRSLPQFKVVPISDVRAIAYALKEKTENNGQGLIIAKHNSNLLYLTADDVEKITREYPDLTDNLK